MKEEVERLVERLRGLGKPENVTGMARFGIVTTKALGVPAPAIKLLARKIKREEDDRHGLALKLWETGIHEARTLAYLIDDPKMVTEAQMEAWAADFDNWATCDSTCGHLFCRTPFAYRKAVEWSKREEEFVKRAGIVMMAWLAVHDKKADDERIAAFLPLLEQLSDDERNFIKKAVNWSVRQIGKRSIALNAAAIETADRIARRGTKASRWIAAGALRELRSDAVRERIAKRKR